MYPYGIFVCASDYIVLYPLSQLDLAHLHRYALISASLPSLFVLCSAYIFIVPGNVYFQSVSGTGNTRAAFILELMALVLYVVYVAIMIFYLRIDVAICWTTEHIYAIGILLFSAAYMKWGKWENKKI